MTDQQSKITTHLETTTGGKERLWPWRVESQTLFIHK